MKNVERIAMKVLKDGSKNILIHTIPGTPNWIICQKIGKDKWLLTLCNPEKNTVYNLGTVTSDQHTILWRQLINTEINMKVSQIQMAKELRNIIKSFLERQIDYENFIKNKIDKKRNKKT